MKFPIIAFCEGDAVVLDEVGQVESHLEPIDVEEGRWVAFDATGRELQISLESVRRPGILRQFLLGTRHVVTVQPRHSHDSAKLREMLRSCLESLSRIRGFPPATVIESATLGELIQLARRCPEFQAAPSKRDSIA